MLRNAFAGHLLGLYAYTLLHTLAGGDRQGRALITNQLRRPHRRPLGPLPRTMSAAASGQGQTQTSASDFFIKHYPAKEQAELKVKVKVPGLLILWLGL